MLKLKLQYFGHLMGRPDSLEKTLILGKIEGEKSYWLQEGEEVGDGRAEESLAIGDGGASFDLTHIWHWWKVLGLK